MHWAHQAAARFPDGQLYVNLRGYDLSGEPVRPAGAIQWLLEALAVPAVHVPSGLQAQTGLYRSLLAGRKMLIVLDNARDPAQVRPLLPGTPGSMVLVTSRSQLTGLAAADGAHMVSLDVLGTAEASALLARRLGSRASAEPAVVSDLARLCAQLPLALNIAAALAIAQPARPLATLADDLRGRQALDALDTGDEASSLRAVLSWSYQRLSLMPARMFRLLGLHPGPDITAAAAASMAGIPAPEARRALRDLAAAHLLAEHSPGRYAFHDLLRAYAADLAGTRDSDAGRQAAVGRMIDHYLHTAHAAATLMCPGRDLLTLAPPLDAVTPEPLAGASAALGWFAAERLVLTAAVTLAAETRHSRQAWQLGWTAGRFLQRGRYQEEWNAVLRTALAAAEVAGDIEGQAHIHRDLGAADTKQPAEAEQHLEQAMNLYGQLGNTAGQAYTELYLGRVCEVRGVNRQILDHALQAMRLFRTIQHAVGQANALTNAGAARLGLGEHEKALAYFKKALRLHRESGNLDGECYAWAGLGEAYFHLGQHDQAIGCEERSADMSREFGNRDLLAGVLGQLGDYLAAAGQPGQARKAWLEAVAILDDLQDPAATEIRGKLARSTVVLATARP